MLCEWDVFSLHTSYEERYGSWYEIRLLSSHVSDCTCCLPLHATWQIGVSPGHCHHGFGRGILCGRYLFLPCLGLHTGPILLVGTPSYNSPGGGTCLLLLLCLASQRGEGPSEEAAQFLFVVLCGKFAHRVPVSRRVTDMVTSTHIGIRKGGAPEGGYLEESHPNGT